MNFKKLLVFIFLFPITVFAHTVILRNMQVVHTKNNAQFIFTLSARAPYRTLTMQHPTRFILDLPQVKTYRKLSYRGSSESPVQHFRYAKHPDGLLRLVFSLKKGTRAAVNMESIPAKHKTILRIVFRKTFLAKLPSPAELTRHSIMADIAAEKEMHHALNRLPRPVSFSSHVTAADDDRTTSHRNVIIVIDAGHGGKDPGATGLGGTKEKNVVLSISKKLRDWINLQPGYHAVLTRSGDYYLTLRQRLRIARKDKADMFVAIHADTWRNREARGVSVFALSQHGATSEAARWLAARENTSELMGGVDLNDQSHLLKSVLINLSQSATIRSSLQIGWDVMNSVKPIARLHHNKVEQAAFVVLKSPDIPSLLIETGFLSNSKEESLLNSQYYQSEISRSIKRGICDYFSHYPPRNTWLSYWRDHPHTYASR